jgi:hypothetical protein
MVSPSNHEMLERLGRSRPRSAIRAASLVKLRAAQLRTVRNEHNRRVSCPKGKEVLEGFSHAYRFL